MRVHFPHRHRDTTPIGRRVPEVAVPSAADMAAYDVFMRRLRHPRAARGAPVRSAATAH